MRRMGIVIAGCVILACTGIYIRAQREASKDIVHEAVLRTPTREQVLQGVKSATPQNPKETLDEAKRRVFSEMIKTRYRMGDPSMAVAIRFTSPTRVRLFIPARMDPWEIDRIAYSLWHEALEDLGTKLTVDVCETYIGMAPVKIGELNHVAGTTDNLKLVYTYSIQHNARTILP